MPDIFTKQIADNVMQIADKSLKASRLLSLPAELQLLIIEAAVLKPEPIKLHCAYFRLFDLPEKICELIWNFARNSQLEFRYSYLAQHFAHHQSVTYTFPEPPVIAEVCRSLRTDALKIYYEQNTFELRFRSAKAVAEQLAKWVKSIDERVRGLVRMVIFAECDQRYLDIWALWPDLTEIHYSARCRCRAEIVELLSRAGVAMLAVGERAGHTLWQFEVFEIED